MSQKSYLLEKFFWYSKKVPIISEAFDTWKIFLESPSLVSKNVKNGFVWSSQTDPFSNWNLYFLILNDEKRFHRRFCLIVQIGRKWMNGLVSVMIDMAEAKADCVQNTYHLDDST